MWQVERRHDGGLGREALLVEHLLGLGHHVLARGLVAVEDVGRRHDAGIHERERRGQKGITVVVRRDLGGRPVGALGVRPGVAHVSHGAQVKDGGATALADGGQRLGDDVEQRCRVRSVGVPVAEAGTACERGCRPPRRRLRAEADAVVLADEQDRAVELAVGQVGGRVEGPGGRRVVHRCVAEAAHHDRVRGPWSLVVDRSSQAEAVAEADGPGQVGGDRRRLGDDAEGRVAEHLVASAGHGVAGRRRETQQDVADRVVRSGDGGSCGVEAAGPVVEQRRIGGPGQQADRRVALVAGRPDRVVALALLLEPARREVEVAALHLGVEEALEHRRAGPLGAANATCVRARANGPDEVFVDRLHPCSSMQRDLVLDNISRSWRSGVGSRRRLAFG